MNASIQKPSREYLNLTQRLGEFVSIFIMVLIVSFFVYHQAANTGFFMAAFGPQEILLFYGSMFLSLLAPVTRALTGRRNPGRPIEVVANLFMAVAALWLLIVFPFDFSHFADALPAGIRFAFAWINDDIGRIPFILQLIVCPLVALAAAWQFAVHFGREPGNRSTPRSAW
jgi:hypothetical protein